MARRILAAVPIAALVAATVACSADAPPLPDRTGPPVAATLSATLARTPEALTWTWTLRNDEPGEVAVFSGGPGEGPGLSNAPEAFVVPRDDATVEVSQRLFEQPPNVGLARPYTQYGTLLPPGTTLSGTATVRLPLALSHPYGSFFKPRLKLPEDPESVVFCLGVGRAQDFTPPVPFEETGDGPVAPSAAPETLYAPPDGPAPPGARKARYLHGAGDRQYLACAPPESL